MKLGRLILHVTTLNPLKKEKKHGLFFLLFGVVRYHPNKPCYHFFIIFITFLPLFITFYHFLSLFITFLSLFHLNLTPIKSSCHHSQPPPKRKKGRLTRLLFGSLGMSWCRGHPARSTSRVWKFIVSSIWRSMTRPRWRMLACSCRCSWWSVPNATRLTITFLSVKHQDISSWRFSLGFEISAVVNPWWTRASNKPGPEPNLFGESNFLIRNDLLWQTIEIFRLFTNHPQLYNEYSSIILRFVGQGFDVFLAIFFLHCLVIVGSVWGWLGGAPKVIKGYFEDDAKWFFKHFLKEIGRSEIHPGVIWDLFVKI